MPEETIRTLFQEAACQILEGYRRAAREPARASPAGTALCTQRKNPAWEQDYARNLSEASQDCTFILGESPYGSFRLGRPIRLIQDLETWPPAWHEELWLEHKDHQ